MKVLMFSICVMIFAGVCFSAADEISVEKNNKEPVMRINDLLEGAGVFYLATSDGDQPKLRPLGAHQVSDGKVWLGVGEFKNVYRQLRKNPKCEVVALQKEGGRWLRWSGRAEFAEGKEGERLEELFLTAMPHLKAIYDGTPGKRMMCFTLADARAELIPLMPPGEIIADESSGADEQWDKVFPKSDKVEHSKAFFRNRFGITLAADVYKPKGAEGKLPAIAVSGPFGAVKEQCSGLYAQNLAERGFLAAAFDPSFTGESSGEPRYVASVDINTEDFQAAVDYLISREDVDPGRIGILGICGWGGIALNAAALDTRVKATVASTMYNMTRVTANGYFDKEDSAEARKAKKEAMNAQRSLDFKAGVPELAGGVVDPLPEDSPQFVKDYYAYYKTPRGYHSRSLNSNGGWAKTSALSIINAKMMAYIDEIDGAVMILHGEKAHSRYFGEDAFKLLKGENKELVIVPGASHCDLYDGGEKNAIPFDKIEKFYKKNLK